MLEIILFFAIGIVGVIGMTALEKNTSEIILKSSLIITAYITTYVVGAIVFDTSLKRIKSNKELILYNILCFSDFSLNRKS